MSPLFVVVPQRPKAKGLTVVDVLSSFAGGEVSYDLYCDGNLEGRAAGAAQLRASIKAFGLKGPPSLKSRTACRARKRLNSCRLSGKYDNLLQRTGPSSPPPPHNWTPAAVIRIMLSYLPNALGPGCRHGFRLINLFLRNCLLACYCLIPTPSPPLGWVLYYVSPVKQKCRRHVFFTPCLLSLLQQMHMQNALRDLGINTMLVTLYIWNLLLKDA